MTVSTPSLARRERVALCDLMDSVGPEAPTLCAGWTTYDLAAHLVLREGSPLSAVGIAVPPLERLTDRGMESLKAKQPYAELVDRVRQGPPLLSPFRPDRVDRAINAVEYFVHHEDVRRADASVSADPGRLDRRDEDSLWRRLGGMGRLLAKRAQVGIELVRTDAPGVHRLSGKEPTVAARGLPSELLLFAYGRGAVADVELEGDESALAGFDHGQLGL
jgi:uncharacterized protein (TIGR03085 family)